MTRPTVLLDCDDVLTDFIGGVLEIVHRVTGRRHTQEDVDQWDFATALKLTNDERRAVQDIISLSRGWCESLAVLPGAVDGVGALREIADVYILTAPWSSCPTWTHERERWLMRRLNIPSRWVIHTAAKHLVWGDVFVDDRTETVEKWATAWLDSSALRWATPHNRRDAFRGTTVSTWDEVLRRVETAMITRMWSSGR